MIKSNICLIGILSFSLVIILFSMWNSVAEFEPFVCRYELFIKKEDTFAKQAENRLSSEIVEQSTQIERAEKIAAILNADEQIVKHFEQSFSLSDSTNIDFTVLSAQRHKGYDVPFMREKLLYVLRGAGEEQNLNFEIRNYTEAATLLSQFPRGMICLTALSLLALLVCAGVQLTRYLYVWVKNGLKRYYVAELIRNKWKSLLKFLGVFFLLLIPAVGLLQKVIHFQFDVAGLYLPERDVFDLAFYRARKQNPVNLASQASISFTRLLSRLEIFSAVYMLFLILLFILLLIEIQKKRKVDSCFNENSRNENTR